MALFEVHEELTHGAELCFEEHLGVPQQQITKMVRRKSSLVAFVKPSLEQPRGFPNYMPKSIADVLVKYARELGADI
jgi:hypothetical protein